VEGFELEVLKGAAKLLSKRPVLIVEIHPLQLKLSGGSEAEIFHLLESFDYSCDVIDRNPNSIYTIIAKASSPDAPPPLRSHRPLSRRAHRAAP
jgi:hypothetical protein